MPGKTEITIAGETWELHEPEGTESFVVVPKVLTIVSEILFTAARGNIDLTALLDEEGLNLAALTSGVLPAANAISRMLTEKWDDILEILPILLCQDAEWLKTHGKPYELLRAMWIAINFQIPGIIGPEQWEALKKSFSEARAEVEAEEQEEDTTTN